MKSSLRARGLVVSSLIAVAAAGALVALRFKRDDTVVRVEPKEQRLVVGAYAFVLGEGARTLTVLGAGGVTLAAATLDVLVAGSPTPLTVVTARAGKGRSVELDVTLGAPGEELHGVLRVAPRKKPAGVELAWVGPRPAAGAVAISLSFGALDPPPLVPGASSTEVAHMDVPYTLLLRAGGTVALGRATVTSAGGPPWTLRADAEGALSLWVGSAAEAAEAAMRRAGIATARRKARTIERTKGVTIAALSERGLPVSAAETDERGEVELAVSAAVHSLRATAGGLAIGPPTDGAEVSAPPLGRLAVTVRDADRDVALPARIVVHGIDGAREPNLGSPNRATGAGPLVDSEDGTFTSLLPAGRYRVLATRGPEYTVDRRDVEITAGGAVTAPLVLRHVVATPGWAACDLHVHSRGSFDSTVGITDRVRSLVAQGIDFAAASEHNRTGSYAQATFANASAWLTWSQAVEVTTTNPLRGHFNVIPWTASDAPKHQRTTLEDLVRVVRRESPDSLVQVNHPRLGGGIGHFHTIRLDPDTGQGLSRLARGFDTLEVYNGFDLPKRDRVEEVIRDWIHLLEGGREHWATGNSDSHSVQYVTAGWPRTYVAVAADHEDGAGAPIDVAALVLSLRRGHAFATSGPFVELTQGAAGPGDSLVVEGGRAKVHVRIRVAPWLDASELEVRVGGKPALVRRLAPRPIEVGPPNGSLADARARTVVFDEDVVVDVPAGARSLVAIVRGDRSVGEVLPFMDFAPLALSNPLLVRP